MVTKSDATTFATNPRDEDLQICGTLNSLVELHTLVCDAIISCKTTELPLSNTRDYL